MSKVKILYVNTIIESNYSRTVPNYENILYLLTSNGKDSVIINKVVIMGIESKVKPDNRE